MYNKFIKPLLFAVSIEQAHSTMVWVLRILGAIPGVKTLFSIRCRVEDSSLEREVFGLKFKNPIGMAPGFDTNGDVIDELNSLGFGFVEVGAVTPDPQIGNPKPRLFTLDDDRAIVNRMGQPNKGLRYTLNNLRSRNSNGMVVGCNIARNNYTSKADQPKDFLSVFRNLYQYVDYFTVNVISSSSVTDGIVFDEESLRKIITPLFEFRRGQSDYRPILIKVSPDLSDEQIDMVTDMMIDTPLDGIVAVSGTFKRDDLKSDTTTIARIGSGRMSGAPINKRALEVVRRIRERSGGAYPIIGSGGVMSPEDARAMLDAGASLVQIYSGFAYEGVKLLTNICKSLIKRK